MSVDVAGVVNSIDTLDLLGKTAPQVRSVLGLAAVAVSGSAADLTAGTLSAARLPATVPLTNAANTFSLAQTFGSTLALGGTVLRDAGTGNVVTAVTSLGRLTETTTGLRYVDLFAAGSQGGASDNRVRKFGFFTDDTGAEGAFTGWHAHEPRWLNGSTYWTEFHREIVSGAGTHYRLMSQTADFGTGGAVELVDVNTYYSTNQWSLWKATPTTINGAGGAVPYLYATPALTSMSAIGVNKNTFAIDLTSSGLIQFVPSAATTFLFGANLTSTGAILANSAVNSNGTLGVTGVATFSSYASFPGNSGVTLLGYGNQNYFRGLVRTEQSLFSTTNAVGTVCQSIQKMASQTANMVELKHEDGSTVFGTVSENGYWTTRKNAAPADAELSSGEAAWWFDSTNGAGKLMVKAKTANGTVVTGSVTLA